MNDEQIFEAADACGFQDDFGRWNFYDESLLNFVFWVKDAEREKVAKWMADRSYATGQGDTIEDLLNTLEGQIKERGSSVAQ